MEENMAILQKKKYESKRSFLPEIEAQTFWYTLHICSRHRLPCSMTNTREKYERTQQGNLPAESTPASPLFVVHCCTRLSVDRILR